ncbi:hypothetical protein BX661DRAFT_198814 [Kickxella alabastrina]|uniref:uncharacterized protein n=1 Tax=Kickxella alabastrina TaxID=61397 RepID=UPI00221F9C59|nr:uncharacterized protein BX661DRAFT_198814 [Kickxella alabastrina]KAI7826803.1 hypothetical protein BX661DRAFT_198814 [Kickxella alabastrina]KAJ1946378.1 hypothetical protein GGF37_001200 [Kickxella alabastrina]
MAFAAGAAVTIPTISAFSTVAYYAKHPGDGDKSGNGQQKQAMRSSISGDSDAHREFILDDDPSEFSSFSTGPDFRSAGRMGRRKSAPMSSSFNAQSTVKPDHSLLEDPELQVWRDRYKWGRKYGLNYAHNDR